MTWVHLKKRIIALGVTAAVIASTASFGASYFASAFSNPIEIQCINRVSLEPNEDGTGFKNDYYVDENGKVVDFEESDSSGEQRVYSVPLPAAFDLRTDSRLTSIKDQGSLGCCWAFSSIGAIESSLITDGLGTVSNVDFSEAHTVWFAQNQRTTDTSDPTYGDGVNDSDPFMSGGHWKMVASTLARGSGPELESNKPYYGQTSQTSLMVYPESDRYVSYARLTGAQQIADSNADIDINTLKTRIYNNGALAASYYNLNSGYNYQYPYGTQQTAFYQTTYTNNETNHGFMIVGWDDSFSKSNFNSSCQPPSDGAWLCKNSWGTDWGNDGYFWMSYNEPSLSTIISYDVADVDIYDNIYLYDGSESISSLAISGYTTAAMANVFTAKTEGESLTHVSFWTEHNGYATYSVEIYKDVTGTGNPEGGTLVTASTTLGTVSFDGFHTVELAAPLTLSQGQVFSVVVTITDPDGQTARIPVEGTDSSRYSALSGVSYLKVGGYWYDVTTDVGANYHNTTVKAYTKNPYSPEEKTFVAESSSNVVIDDAKQCVYGITPGATESSILAMFAVTGNSHAEIAYSGSIGTGSVVRHIDDDDFSVISEYQIVIFGDINGDGIINSVDSSQIAQTIIGTTTITSGTPYFYAADLNGDGLILSVDASLMNAVIIGSKTLDQVTGRTS